MRWPLQPLQPFQQTQLQRPFGQSVDSLCHLWFTTTNVSYRFPILKLPPPPCAVLLVYRNTNWANSYYSLECVSTFETCWGTPCLKDRRSQFWALSNKIFCFRASAVLFTHIYPIPAGLASPFCLSLRQKKWCSKWFVHFRQLVTNGPPVN